ncbi:MAG: molybdopterin-guanine dinucleotide biosynthesis protein MobB, partial [Sulfolobales archaeon]|nr:molybdopterin-guanine dinucleotide biosynthesis protein MobB [Sulfolobales archaeon]
GVIKHSASRITLEEKDSSRYLSAGAMEVVVSSRELTVLYSKTLIDDLSDLLKYVSKPLIVVEGFRDVEVGDSVIVTDSLEEAVQLLKKSTVAIVINSRNRAIEKNGVGNAAVLYSDQVRELTDLIVRRAVDHVTSQLPGLNCGMCGVDRCESLATKILKGERERCPVVLGVKLVVNEREVTLNPFVKNLIKSTITGLLSSLKGVPENVRRVVIEVSE